MYYFEGWYRDEAGTTDWDFTGPVTGDLRLYAKWIPVLGPGSGDLTIEYRGPGDETIALGDDQVLSWTAGQSLTIRVPDTYDSYQWFVDGEAVSGAAENEFSITARQFSIKEHRVTLRVQKGDQYYSKETAFTVGL
jgi:uncharacterized repeat protein (TIGR02543 family)